MADTFQLEIVTPEKMVVDTTWRRRSRFPARTGISGVLPGHAPLITELAVGEISYRENAIGADISRSPGDSRKCFRTR